MRVPLFLLICACVCAKVMGEEVFKSSEAKALCVALPSGSTLTHHARGFVSVGVCVSVCAR